MSDIEKDRTGGKKRSSGKNGSFDGDALPEKIGSSLRRLYDDVLSEDVPDDFLNLLKQADGKPGRAAK